VKNIIFIIYTTLILAACGGSSSSTTSTPNNSDNNETVSKIGVFIDAPVKGLSYTSSPSGKKGITNEKGEFEYIDGDTVSFNMGSIELGKAVPDKDKTVKVTQLREALLVAQLLQVLDADADENKIDVSDILIPKEIEETIFKKLKGTAEISDEDEDENIITAEEFKAIKQKNPYKLTLQQRTEIVTKDRALKHIKQQIGESGLKFSTSSLENQWLIDSVFLTTYEGGILGFSTAEHSISWVEIFDSKAEYSDVPWSVDSQGDLEVTVSKNDSCRLSKLAEYDLIHFDYTCTNAITKTGSKGIRSLTKPQPFSANDLSGKSFNFSSLSGNKETLTFRSDGTLNCNEKSSCSYKDHTKYKNLVLIEGGGDSGEKSALMILAQGSLAKGRFVMIHYKDDGITLDSVEVMKVSGNTLKQVFKSAANDESGNQNNNTNENSDSNDNPNSGTQNTNYSPFTQEMVSGKTLYNVYIDWDDQDKDGSTTDWVASTFTFDNSGEGKGVFGIHDSITKADASFNFSINDKGYLILSNVTFTNPEDDPDDGHSTDAIGLIEDAGESFKVCWRGSPEQLNNGNGCDGNERFYKIKADAEAALEAPEIVYSDDYSDREDDPYAIQNPNYSPFSEKIVAGKTFYVSGVEKDDNLTISFDANKKGKVWLSLAENTTPPDMIFDYLIDTEGYVVFFNVKENGVDSEYSPAMGLLVENNHALIVCWSNYSLSDIRDVCKNDDKMIMYKTKDAAQAEIRADDEYFDDHSDYVDNPDPGTKNPDYIRFTQEMISGKTLYSLSTPKNYDEQHTKVTVQFDNSKTGKYQFGFHENVSSPYGTFDYRINDQGYIIFSNLVVDGGALIGLESTHGLFFRDTTFLELCVATSKESLERNECVVEVWFYSKEDAEGSI
jgi:hypothetical protein